jgi:hypothetical protein
MNNGIPQGIDRLIRRRQAMLWVCQPYDLAAGQEAHDYDVPAIEAALRYRQGENEDDRLLADFYWEAAWIEGAKSPLIKAFRDEAGRNEARPLVLLVGPMDAQAQVPAREFFPVSVLPGLLEDNVAGDAQYGTVKGRVRERTAWELTSRLREYPGRALIVVGAAAPEHLQRVYSALEDVPLTDLSVLLIWPANASEPPAPSNPAISWNVWRGSVHEWCDSLKQLGAPGPAEVPQWAIRIGARIEAFTAAQMQRIVSRFALITERDIQPPASFGLPDLQAFLSGNLDNWSGYSAGLPVSRSYTSQAGKSLLREVEEALAALSKGDTLTFSLNLPADGGSGATTLLRAAAHQAASQGFPTLILRPDQVNIDPEEILAFHTTLSERLLSQGKDDLPPMVIIVDREHEQIAKARSFVPFLASHRCRALIVQATANEDKEEQRTQRWVRLRPLQAKTDTEEADRCAQQFAAIVARWDIPLELPSIEEWRNYERNTQWVTPGGASQSLTMFWVALRFFLTERMEFTAADQTQDALGAWIERRVDSVGDPQMTSVIKFVAALSSFRIISPVWTVLRPVSSSRFSSSLIGMLKKLSDIATWGEYSQELEDQVLHFLHPALADEFLRRSGYRSAEEKLELLAPVLKSLSPGHPADIWVADSIAATVLAPGYSTRRTMAHEWSWRLRAFNMLPQVIREQSKTVLHHWARCLYQSVESDGSLSPADKKQRFELAIEKLRKATSIERRRARDEHPSHIFNTLGTAYYRYVKLLEESGSPKSKVDEVWAAACAAFEKSISLSGGTNVEALLAFSHRLLSHAGLGGETEPVIADANLRDVAQALSLLDEADDAVARAPIVEPEVKQDIAEYRAQALRWLDSEAARDYIGRLKESATPDLGYYCEVRLMSTGASSDEDFERALQIFDEAQSRDIALSGRTILLWLSLLQRHSEQRFNFALQRKLYTALEADSKFVIRLVDSFRHAVLCYQVGDYANGKERFRRLRESIRRSDNQAPPMRDYWLDSGHPERPRVTQAQVRRIISEWRAEGYVADLQQSIPLRPRHFSPPPKEHETVRCIVRFDVFGPIAVPERFAVRR